MAGEATPGDSRGAAMDGRVIHNHVTRDIKAPGICPACDLYHERQNGERNA